MGFLWDVFSARALACRQGLDEQLRGVGLPVTDWSPAGDLRAGLDLVIQPLSGNGARDSPLSEAKETVLPADGVPEKVLWEEKWKLFSGRHGQSLPGAFWILPFKRRRREESPEQVEA